MEKLDAGQHEKDNTAVTTHPLVSSLVGHFLSRTLRHLGRLNVECLESEIKVVLSSVPYSLPETS